VLQRPVEPSQYLAVRYTERLAEAGVVASVGSKGDSYDCEHHVVAAAEV
jgi:putative transposase